MSIDNIHPHDFHFVSSKLRAFFEKKRFLEVPVQHRLSILAACEDPTTLSTFEYTGYVWPLPQTGQMWLEYELLSRPAAAPGYFCCSTSYRQELKPVAGRHNLIFPMFEFELQGGISKLVDFEKELLVHLGYDKNTFQEGTYDDVCKKYGVTSLEHTHENMLYDETPVFFLKHFPVETSPFWNMLVDPTTGTANKVDVIMSGVETIGSAERSCDPVAMRHQFNTISDGTYATTLFGKFGNERVEKELDDFLFLPLIPRCGGGIGVNRLIRALKMENILI